MRIFIVDVVSKDAPRHPSSYRLTHPKLPEDFDEGAWDELCYQIAEKAKRRKKKLLISFEHSFIDRLKKQGWREIVYDGGSSVYEDDSLLLD